VDQTNIVKLNAGTPTILATHSTAFLSGDRMTATCSGNVITVFRNGTQVSTATDAFNNTQTNFGMIVDVTSTIVPPILGKNPKPNATPGVFQRDKRKRSRVSAQGIDHVYRSFA